MRGISSGKAAGCVIAVLLAALLVAGATGCGSSGPADTVEDFLQAALDKDCRKMVELSSTRSLGEQTRDEAIQDCESSEELSSILAVFEGIELESFEAIEEDIRGEDATVKARMTFRIADNEETTEETFKLVQETGEWKVDL